MEKSYTVLEVLEMTANQLGLIAVPRSLNQQIGVPIDNAIDNIHACIAAMSMKKEDSNESEVDEEVTN